MENEGLCPFCGKIHSYNYLSDGFYSWKCADNNIYFYCEEINDLPKEEKNKIFNVIYNFVFKNKHTDKKNKNWNFAYFSNTDDIFLMLGDKRVINTHALLKNYPYSSIQKINAIILNLTKRFPSFSDTFSIDCIISKGLTRLFYCESECIGEELKMLFSSLVRFNYIEPIDNYNQDLYRITIEGWIKAEELEKETNDSKKCFIAMSFAEEASEIENAFKEAIKNANFTPMTIKDKPHNNYIMPEIFYEIKTSKFVVVDITYPNYGAYFEAGYAMGLGKEAIICCSRENFKKHAHFDIAQKNTVIWDSIDDLKNKLYNRIKATIDG